MAPEPLLQQCCSLCRRGKKTEMSERPASHALTTHFTELERDLVLLFGCRFNLGLSVPLWIQELHGAGRDVQ